MAEDSRVEENAMRLLEAFHDASGGKLNESVPLGGSDTEEDGAADRAGFTEDHTERNVALNYLLGQGYVQPDDDGTGYRMTVSGLDHAREVVKPTEVESEERSGLQDKSQRQLMTLISTVVSIGISTPITNYISEQIPERRGIKDDLLEAFLEGLVRAISMFVAGLAVRQIAFRRGQEQ